MNESYLKIALGICIMAVLALVFVNYVDLSKDNYEPPYGNEELTSLTEFNVAYDETNTYAKGTAFVMQGKDSLRMRIVADVVVGEDDPGGVSFNFTPDLKVTKVLCSFNDDVSEKYVSIFYYVSTSVKYNTIVEVAREHPILLPNGVGNGTVILDVQLNGHTALKDIDSLYFTVAVGGKGNTVGIVHEEIPIPLL